MTAPPTPLPRIESWGEPFWEGAREGRLLLQECPSCEITIFYPKKYCPACGTDDLAWFEASGRGAVYTHSTVVADLHPTFSDDRPYTVAVVELEEGVRMLSNVVDCDPDDITSGMAVEVQFETVADEVAIPLFAPVDAD